MMGDRLMAQEALFYSFSLERHVPRDLLRSLDQSGPRQVVEDDHVAGPNVPA